MGDMKPAAHESVFEKPKTVPTKAGAISGTICMSPPVAKPNENMVIIRPNIITSARPFKKGMLNKKHAGPRSAETYNKTLTECIGSRIID